MDLQVLGDEIWLKIAYYLPLKDFINFSLINKYTFNVYKNPKEFGDTRLYQHWLNEAGIAVDYGEIAPTAENQNKLLQITDLEIESSSKAPNNFAYINSEKSFFYNSDMIAYRDRFFIVNSLDSNFKSNLNSKYLNGKVAANILFLIKEALKEVSEGNSDFTQMRYCSIFSNNGDLLELFTNMIKVILLIMNEFPWSPECFHLLGFICYFIGKDKISRNFLNLSLSICNSTISYGRSNQMDTDENEINGKNILVDQFKSSLSLNESPNSNALILQVKDEVLSILEKVELNLAATMGSESNDFQLLDEESNNLHKIALDKLRKLFDFFDEDKNQLLSLTELGNLVNFTNTDLSISNQKAFTIKYFKSLNLPSPNPALLKQVINKYEPLSQHLQSSINYSKPQNQKNFKVKQNNVSKTKQNYVFSFDSLVSFYLDQTLQDPSETRKDLKKIDFFLN
ncbi:hypothetical protein BB561_001496 [Smittium simulii]|uniref:EF-hand domain-containing protein n=1 Tax=Smittium simulii TaxID=133385 RepID=A0A2T9YUC6_9FUNG|nr:hypothetical protein BB561_001496 [Smittium simulii]